MSKYSIEESTLTGIADAVRDLRYENDPLTPAEIEAKIRDVKTGINVDIHVEDGPWVRPDDWPNLDEIEMNDDFDGVYLTYDLRKTPDYGWIGVYVITKQSGSSYVERGHLENGSFVTDEQFIISSGAALRKPLDEANGTVQLWRVVSDKQITRFGFRTSANTTNASLPQKYQPCVEATGRLPYVTSIASDSMNVSQSYISYSTIWMERDSRICGENSVVTSLLQAWSDCYNLRSLDVSKWDTSNWAVTSLAGTFRNCYNLPEIDLSGWNTSNWAVTSLSFVFGYCYSLETLDLSDWDTSNWAVTNFENGFANCANLRELDIGAWDTSNWAVTKISSLFTNNFSLEYLDLNHWNTSKWKITSLSGLFKYCYSLKKLCAGQWDTSNWAVTSLSEMFRYCRSLQTVDIGEWDTSNWAVTSLAYMFDTCESLKAVDLNKWDTNNWAVESLKLIFNECYSLKTINIGEWDTSNWIVNTMELMCAYCVSLETFDFDVWDTSNWPLTSIASLFHYCMSLKRIDLTHWNTSNWIITGIRYLVCYCFSLEYIDVTGWDSSNFNFANNGFGYTFDTCRNLATVKGFETWDLPTVTQSLTIPSNETLMHYTGLKLYINHSYSSCYSLTRESLINILTALPIVNGKTITLGDHNKRKLTPEEIAIATDKGWTVA